MTNFGDNQQKQQATFRTTKGGVGAMNRGRIDSLVGPPASSAWDLTYLRKIAYLAY
jgi:hypothetical protein